jgi:hypothetical protein
VIEYAQLNIQVNEILQQEELHEQLLTDMAQCALMALAIEQQTGKCGFGPTSEHKFLSKWLTAAYKQKRFAKETAPTLQALTQMAKEKGQFAGLKANLIKLSKPEENTDSKSDTESSSDTASK